MPPINVNLLYKLALPLVQSLGIAFVSNMLAVSACEWRDELRRPIKRMMSTRRADGIVGDSWLLITVGVYLGLVQEGEINLNTILISGAIGYLVLWFFIQIRIRNYEGSGIPFLGKITPIRWINAMGAFGVGTSVLGTMLKLGGIL